jgi:hypothetical protein
MGNEMIEALTGVFGGGVCALFAAAFGCMYNRGKQFDFWILIVGAFVGFIAVQVGATFFGWQEWFYTVVALTLFEYGSKAAWKRLNGRVRIEREQFLVWVLNWTTAVYIVLFLVMLFLLFLPFLFGSKFMIYKYEYGKLVFRWFATSIPQIERDAFVASIIFGFPLMSVFSYFALSGGKDGNDERRGKLGV